MEESQRVRQEQPCADLPSLFAFFSVVGSAAAMAFVLAAVVVFVTAMIIISFWPVIVVLLPLMLFGKMSLFLQGLSNLVVSQFQPLMMKVLRLRVHQVIPLQSSLLQLVALQTLALILLYSNLMSQFF